MFKKKDKSETSPSNKQASASSKQASSKTSKPVKNGRSSQTAAALSVNQNRPVSKRRLKLIEKIDMYDMIIANLIAGGTVLGTNGMNLGGDELHIGFSEIDSDTQISKYWLIRQFPDYLQPQIIDAIRYHCIRPGVKVNVYVYGDPYKIDWESPEMKSKMSIWREYTSEETSTNVFDYRSTRATDLAKKRIVLSTKYLNDAELNQRRSLIKASFLVEITGNNNDEDILNMNESIQAFKEFCNLREIRVRELRVNMIEWMKSLNPFSLLEQKAVINKTPSRILTDDLLSNMNSYKQGRIGIDGVPLGMDVETSVPVLKKFKADPDAAENWLVSAGTGGGKSYWVKVLLTFLLASGYVVTVMDYEGDEYSNIAAYLSECNEDDVRVISMGKGSSDYFDPCQIPQLTGDPEVDDELKEQSINYIIAIFRIIVAGLDGYLDTSEEKMISTAIRRMYDSAGVTDDKSTWTRSKNLTLRMVYEELKYMYESKEFVDSDDDNKLHKAITKIVNASSIYFEDGESKANTFKNPIPADDLYSAKFIVFSFGMKGAGHSTIDPTILALKQLSVASVSMNISNHCKYIKHCFNVKVWEEFQRWGNAKGSVEIIVNAMTGGRKRGDINIIITNDLANIVDESNEVSKSLRQNIQNYAIGKISDRNVRETFCDIFDLKDCELALQKIAKSNSSDEQGLSGNAGGRYKHSFCVILDTGKKAVVKAMIPPALAKSGLFKTGVII